MPEKNPLGDGHVRSSRQIEASIAATRTTIPATTSKSAMAKHDHQAGKHVVDGCPGQVEKR
jgi:hypothetical protein